MCVCVSPQVLCDDICERRRSEGQKEKISCFGEIEHNCLLVLFFFLPLFSSSIILDYLFSVFLIFQLIIIISSIPHIYHSQRNKHTISHIHLSAFHLINHIFTNVHKNIHPFNQSLNHSFSQFIILIFSKSITHSHSFFFQHFHPLFFPLSLFSSFTYSLSSLHFLPFLLFLLPFSHFLSSSSFSFSSSSSSSSHHHHHHSITSTRCGV